MTETLFATATAFLAPPDLMKRFAAAPYTASVTTGTATYQITTNYAPLSAWLSSAREGRRPRWDCTILCDLDYPIEQGDALTFASEGLLLHLRPGRMISVDSVHHRIVAFLSDLVPDQAAAHALLRELAGLSQSRAMEGARYESL